MTRLLLTFIVAIPVIARADLADDRAALREAVTLAKGLKPYEYWVAMMLSLAEAQGRCGDREAAHDTFAIVTDAIVKIDDPEATRYFFGSLAHSQARAGLAEDARHSIERFGKAPKVYNKAVAQDNKASIDRFITALPIEALIEIGDYPAARELARAHGLENGEFTDKEKAAGKLWIERTLVRIDDAETRVLLFKGDPVAKKRAVASTLERAKTTVDPRAANRIYSTLSSNQADAGDFAGAKASADRITIEGKAPTSKAASLHAIAIVQLEAGDRAGAAETACAALALHRAAKAPAPPKSGSRWFTPEKLIADTLGVIAGAESPDAALKLKDELEGATAQLEACLAIAKVRADQKDRDGARALTNQAETLAQGIEDPTVRAQAIDEVMTSRIRLGLADDFEAAINAVSPSGRNGAQMAAMMELAKRGDCTVALKLSTTIKSSFMEGRFPVLIASIAATSGHADTVLSLARVAKTDEERCQWLQGMAGGLSNRAKKGERLAGTPRP